VGKGQTCPASFDALQETNKDHVLRPGVSGLVGLGGMIEEVRTPKDRSACFGVNEIIRCDQKTPIGQGIGNHAPQRTPQGIPGEFAGCHKGIATSVDSYTEQGIHAPEKV